jgi:isochorismate pyruvate lyase
MKEAKECQNIEEIRNEIDGLDLQILTLFGKRLEYVKEIVKFKSDADGIVALQRQKEVFQNRKEWAANLDLDPELFGEIFEKLINWNVQKELELFRNSERENI